jgi:hypothetical protein
VKRPLCPIDWSAQAGKSYIASELAASKGPPLEIQSFEASLRLEPVPGDHRLLLFPDESDRGMLGWKL